MNMKDKVVVIKTQVSRLSSNTGDCHAERSEEAVVWCALSHE